MYDVKSKGEGKASRAKKLDEGKEKKRSKLDGCFWFCWSSCFPWNHKFWTIWIDHSKLECPSYVGSQARWCQSREWDWLVAEFILASSLWFSGRLFNHEHNQQDFGGHCVWQARTNEHIMCHALIVEVQPGWKLGK